MTADSKKDDLGDRMKDYERHETGRRFLPMLPVYARIDGRGFSKFTKGMERPFDQRMTDAMIETTRYLVKETHALVGYVQSDEISLLWKAHDYTGSIFFDGKIAKMTSVLASMAAAAFGRQIRGWEPFEDRYPAFDARVLQLPLDYEAANMFLWRSLDATKNAVSMATRAHFSAKKMHGQDQRAMLKMLASAGVDFGAFPASFRQGTFLKRVVEDRTLTAEELEAIPEGKRPDSPIVKRARIATMDWPPFHKIANRTDILFDADADVWMRTDLRDD
jgi:tRNA(His) guanylyltransferase